jgi:hypothetical protein
MNHGSFTWRASKRDVRTAVATFLVGGPLLCAPVWLLMGWGVGDTPGAMVRELLLAPLLVPAGFASWWNWALQPRMALMTWVPTLAAGITCGYLLRLLTAWSWYQRVARVLKLMVAATVCAIISALIYETTWGISNYIGAMPVPTSTRFFARGGGVPMVAVIGFILGAYLTWHAARRTREAP